MDTSQEYILLCEKAQEIQNQWKHSKRNSGDYYFHKKLNAVYVVSDEDQKDEDCIWLPRQDQLQAMLFGKSLQSQMKTFHKFKQFDFNKFLNTWEKLWLHIVMADCYCKEWWDYRDEQEWVDFNIGFKMRANLKR